MENSQPVPMILTCPSCNTRHIDRGKFETNVHHTHACQNCGMVWRPAIGTTVGVQFLPGYKDEEKSEELCSNDVKWIVNQAGELGVRVNNQNFYLYKGESIQHNTIDEDHIRDTGIDLRKWRYVGKREFGESCLSPDPRGIRYGDNNIFKWFSE
jgi:rubredoxin